MPDVAAVIPVLDPEPGLTALCDALVAAFARVILVDDGSARDRGVFDAIVADHPNVTVLRHASNRGKGAAMKTALAHLRDATPEIRVAVFADGDGQHRAHDVVAVAARARTEDAVIFGVRDFFRRGVPFRSLWGNLWTSLEVRLLLGLRVRDTQTGLRAIPRRLFDAFLSLSGERFEYEAGAFRLLKGLGETIREVPIETVYIASNRRSHFRPFADTLLTQRALFKTQAASSPRGGVGGCAADGKMVSYSKIKPQKGT